jgi:hypothetical protein
MDGGVGNPPAGMNATILQAAGAFGGYPEMALHLLAQQQAGAAHMVSHAHGMQHNMQQQQDDGDERGASRGGRTRSGDSRSSSAYASRHQQAEARRRTRINER